MGDDLSQYGISGRAEYDRRCQAAQAELEYERTCRNCRRAELVAFVSVGIVILVLIWKVMG